MHVAVQEKFLAEELNPRLEAAKQGAGHVLFVDASHMVHGSYSGNVWSIETMHLRAASGRQRFNVLGAWNAVTRGFVKITNATVVNTPTLCELLDEIAALKLSGRVTLVMDNARYQRNDIIRELAADLGIELLFLPSYSPNLNLIERLWRFVKRTALRGRYHADFASFRAAIERCLADLATVHDKSLVSLMTLKFQRLPDVSLHAA